MTDATATKARPKLRCNYPGCTRYARPGIDRCTAHKATPLPIDDREPSAFEAQLERGDYRALFGDRLLPILAQAAAENTADTEIGILRLVMARLLAEETDPALLVSGVARLSSVIIQALKANRALSGQVAESLTDAITTILETIE